jgi:hypothetical protein
LFYGHVFPGPDDQGIILEGDDPRLPLVHIQTGAFVREELEDGTTRRVRVRAPDFFGEPRSGEFEYAILLEDEKGSRWLMDLDRGPARFQRSSPSREEGVPVQVLPTGSLEQSAVGLLWDRISLTESERTVLEALRLLDPGIEGVALVEDHSSPRSKDRVPIIATREFREPVPLSSMGDGMTRIFQLVLALVSARGGMLLVDEFENGLHWSVQKAVWEMVWRLAYSLEVQVFATTHSRDCVRAFAEGWQRSPGDGAFYRLERDSRGIADITRYPHMALLDSITSGVEMR